MRAWPKLSNYRRRSQKWYSIHSQKWYSIHCGHDGHVNKTIIRTLIHSLYSHCHNGAFSWSIKFSVYNLICSDWMTICSMFSESTLAIQKSISTVAWSKHWVILQGATWLWWQGANGLQNFSDDVSDLAFNQWTRGRVQSWIEFWYIFR